jgi:hypothetical protein
MTPQQLQKPALANAMVTSLFMPRAIGLKLFRGGFQESGSRQLLLLISRSSKEELEKLVLMLTFSFT